MSKVSVIIPTYNGSAFIAQALESVFAQTLLPQEIIVVDDASTDGTPNLVEQIAKNAPVPLRMIRLTENSGGPARPMNTGIERTTSEYIALLDHDDEMMPEKLALQTDALDSTPEAALCFGDCILQKTEGEHVHPNEQLRMEILNRARDRGSRFLLEPQSITELQARWPAVILGCSNIVFRREAFLRFGPFDESRVAICDYLFKLKVCSQVPAVYAPALVFRKGAPGTTLFQQSWSTALQSEIYSAGLSTLRSHFAKDFKTGVWETWLPSHYLRIARIHRNAGQYFRSLGVYLQAARLPYGRTDLLQAALCFLARRIRQSVSPRRLKTVANTRDEFRVSN